MRWLWSSLLLLSLVLGSATLALVVERWRDQRREDQERRRRRKRRQRPF